MSKFSRVLMYSIILSVAVKASSWKRRANTKSAAVKEAERIFKEARRV